MGDDHPFTVKIYELVASFATRREAETDGHKAMRLLVTLAISQMTKLPQRPRT